ncbi:hypothetical protein ACFL0D_03525, partial [Thermoproteota archaeon]
CYLVFFSEGDDGAYHIKFPYVKPKTDEEKEVEKIREAMKEYLDKPEYLSPYVACHRYCNRVCQYKDIGENILENSRFYPMYPKLVLSIVEGVDITDSLLQMFETGNDLARISGDSFGVKLCAALQGAERYFEDLGRKYHWNYTEQETLVSKFIDIYLDSLKRYIDQGAISLDQGKTGEFREQYRNMVREKQPTQYCPSICSDRTCQYRYVLTDLLDDEYYHTNFVDTINTGEEDIWYSLITISREAVNELIPDLNDEASTKISNCYILQKTYQIEDFSQRHIEQIMSNILEENVPFK